MTLNGTGLNASYGIYSWMSNTKEPFTYAAYLIGGSYVSYRLGIGAGG